MISSKNRTIFILLCFFYTLYMKQILALAGLLTLSCGEQTEENQPEENNSSWEEIFPCNPKIKKYLSDSKTIISNYKEEIENWIEENVRSDLQAVPPSDVIELLLDDRIDILCGMWREGRVPIPVAICKPFDEIIILNNPLFEKWALDYQMNGSFLDHKLEFDPQTAEKIINESGIDGYHEMIRITKLIANGIGALVHEYSHAAWYDNDLKYTHEKPPIDYSNDPFYQYGWSAKNAYLYLLIGQLNCFADERFNYFGGNAEGCEED